MKKIILCGVVMGMVAAYGDVASKSERVFREARLTRGNTNIAKVQPIDEAWWIWSADDDNPDMGVFVFRNVFEVKEGEASVTIDVSADERFYLTLDGNFVARGPNRGTVENWQYQTYRLTFAAPGKHELRAVVTRLGGHAPLAQMSYSGGFILKADETFDARLTTGAAKWEVARFVDMKPCGADNGVWGTGSQFEVTGSGPFAVEPKGWKVATLVRCPAATNVLPGYGSRRPGWMLFPSQIPDQMESYVRPGTFRAAMHDAPWRCRTNVYELAHTKAPEVAAFNELLKNGTQVVIPANTRLQLAWHLGQYYCAYPLLGLAGGKGSRVSWTWTESTRNAKDKLKAQRSEIVGKTIDGYGDVFVSDGRNGALFSTPWFRCGLWCRIDIETKDEPLEINSIGLIENRYPLEMESAFASPNDASLGDIRRICTRAMQMCCHEMLFDCPYYEQQMYPGDTRVQLLAISALTRDDRIIKRAIEIYDLGTRDDGQCPFNWPTRGTQEGFTYTLCYLCMYGDYAMNHADRDWLRARLPGLRKSMAGCELYENKDGLVENTPGWNFMDWTVEWHDSAVPGSNHGIQLNAFNNLFWLLAMQSAATTERALGNDLQARYWDEKAAKLKDKIFTTFWDAKRCLFADTPAKKTFSEHIQALAILTDVFSVRDNSLLRSECFRHLVEDKDLARTTVYFNYYLFEAYFKMGRADLFQKRLDLWRGYVAKGITTLSEMPDEPDEGRSDCHAWGAHPLWFMQTGLAGIHSDAPFFARVRIAPQPGSLKKISVKHPHPRGWISAELTFDGNVAHGTVSTPVPGTFVYGDQTVELKPGANTL